VELVKYIRYNHMSGDSQAWKEAKAGARAYLENGRLPCGPGAPMLSMEAERFADMEQRGVKEMKACGVIYKLQP
jgi:hypothetical protein